MYPPVQISLGRLSYDRTHSLLAPFIPGGTFVLLLLIRNPYLVSHARAQLGFGRYSVAVTLIFAAYVCGFVFQNLSTGIYVLASIPITSYLRSKGRIMRQNESRASGTAWRAIVAKLLGDDLAPAPLAAIEVWTDWYNILQDYLRERPIIPNDTWNGLIALEATGLVIIVTEFAFPTHRHWGLLGIGVLSVLMGIIVPHFILWSYLKNDIILYWQFSARLLREIHPLAKRADPTDPT
jgi:hypothetical protein